MTYIYRISSRPRLCRYRLWVQPYKEDYHTPLTLGESVGSALLIGSPWELDVPKCAEGIPGCSFEAGSWIHTITGNTVGKHTFHALNVSLLMHCPFLREMQLIH